jgi:hypothetical protein
MIGIGLKIAKLKKLESLYVNLSDLFFQANIELSKNWLNETLPFFPKSLKVVKLKSCRVFSSNYISDNVKEVCAC